MTRRCFPRAPNAAAFTLLQTLVVVAIMAVLLVVSAGAYRRVLDSAKGAVNISNHRTIARGLLAYAQDFGGTLPWSEDDDPPFGDGVSSLPNSYSPYPKTLCILGYVSNGSVFFSPRFWPRWGEKERILLIVQEPSRYPSAIIPWAYTNYGVSRYGAMPSYSDRGGGRRPANLLKVAADGNLSKLMLTRDTYYAGYDQAPSNLRGGGIHWFANESNIPEEKDTYAGIVHAAFADGHAQGFRRDEMVKMSKSSTAAPMFYNVYTLP